MIISMKDKKHTSDCSCADCEVRRLRKEMEFAFKGVEQEIDGFVKRLIALEDTPKEKPKRKWRWF